MVHNSESTRCVCGAAMTVISLVTKIWASLRSQRLDFKIFVLYVILFAAG